MNTERDGLSSLLHSVQTILSLIAVDLKQVRDAYMSQSLATKEVMSVEEAMQFLGIAKGTLYKLTSKGQIPFKKVGKRLVFLRTELTQWLSTKSHNAV
jgi:excisionase family DNA binding protein